MIACEKLASTRAQHYLENAKKLYDAGDYKNAIKECDNALTFTPSSFDALSLKGMSYYQVADYENSIVWLQSAAKQKPEDKQLKRLLIDSFMKTGKYFGAINEIELLLRDDPQNEDLIFLYYYTHIKTRIDSFVGKAQNALKQLIEQNCKDLRIYCLAAELEILKENFSEAEKLLLQHYTPEAIWQNTMLLLADAYIARKDYKKTIEIYHAIIEKAEDKKTLYKKLAEALFRNKQYTYAAEVLKTLHEQDPDDTMVRQKFIDCLIASKHYDSAEHIIDSAIQKLPDDADLIKAKISVLMEKGDLNTALKVAQTKMALYPKESLFYRELKNKIAEIYFLQGNNDEATKIIKEILKEYPTDMYARFTYCKIKLKNSTSIALIGELRQLINENPNNAEYYYYLGLAHQKRQETVMADKAFRGALEKDPGHRGALLALAEINFKAGSFNIIEKDIQNYFKIHPDDKETLRILNSMKETRPGST